VTNQRTVFQHCNNSTANETKIKQNKYFTTTIILTKWWYE